MQTVSYWRGRWLEAAEALGVDPGYLPGARAGGDDLPGLSFDRAWFDPAAVPFGPDLVVCRHTLEHVDRVAPFLRGVTRVMRSPGARAFFETPDAARVLREGAFWDIYYEHCSYFSEGDHARALRAAGLEVTGSRLAYAGQYIVQHAAPAAGRAPVAAEGDLPALRALAAGFPGRVAGTLNAWRRRLESARAAGQRVALWGGGSKAVAFLSDPALADCVTQVVDINPYKQGRFLPGTGHRVEAPAALADTRPDLVIAMNPVYRAEIAADLRGMGLSPALEAL